MAVTRTCDRCTATLTTDNDATHGCVLIHPELGRIEIVRKGTGMVCLACLRTSLSGVEQRAPFRDVVRLRAN